MAKNDLILIDSIIDKRVADKYPSEKKDEVFEYLAYEQVFSEYPYYSEKGLPFSYFWDGWVKGLIL